MATGFTRCGISTSEGGSIEAELLASYAKEARGNQFRHVHGSDPGLLLLPRPQVRPRVAEGVLRVLGLLPQHDPERHRPPHGRRRAALHPRAGQGGRGALERRLQADGRRQGRRGRLPGRHRPGQETQRARPAAKARRPPGRAAGQHAGTRTPVAAPGGRRQRDQERAGRQLPAHRQARVDHQQPVRRRAELRRHRLRRTGQHRRFRHDRRVFLRRLGPGRRTDTSSGAIFARMDRNNNERGWDLYLDHGRPTVHLINFWPRNAIKQVAVKTAHGRARGSTFSSPTTAVPRRRA